MPMEFKQKTIGDIIESEHLMLSSAPQRYGAYYTIAIDLFENGACAAFAIANPDPAHFASTTPEGTLDASQKLTIKRYEWLNKHFPQGSSSIEATNRPLTQTLRTQTKISALLKLATDSIHRFSTSRTSIS
jgi:hypothetical protein